MTAGPQPIPLTVLLRLPEIVDLHGMPDSTPPADGPDTGFQECVSLCAQPLEVRRALATLKDKLRPRLPAETLDRLELVLAEVLNNIVEHAYADAPDGGIEVRIASISGKIFCHFNDLGVEIPGGSLPVGHFPRTHDVSLEDLPEGGFGWAMIHTLTDGISYRHWGGHNFLTLRISA